ncbi:prolyl oligopeptidase family serine peptidase [Altererythrobacter arenosus]|uniref:Prolyl oligopeptidase family serine peptidase n=1 Tax=Altererythrobacter arenosus TaxID=3032592 RepID=A0ABY8FRR5_9SPHN|nr:prolyl oligopeptidase family serine peptidase [Altererythrobacter sp. CAU 1644]WFL77711.1 prolyl oligopeptidase family serine peptidase [Altererythrobacter sp. CAU 1644]
MKYENYLLAAALACMGTTAAGQSPEPMTAIDFVEISQLDEPTLSPDGKTLAFLQSHTDWKENKVIERLQLLNVETGVKTAAITAVKEDETHSGAVWSPDGSQFLTLLERKGDKEKQVYLVIPSTGSIERLTELEDEVEDPVWAGDGTGFYFLAARPLDEDTRKLRKRQFLVREYETREPAALWHFDLATRKAAPVIAGEFFLREYSLARDGGAVIDLRAPGGLGDDIHRGELWLTRLADGTTRQLTRNEYAERYAKLSPDNTHFAFIATVNEKGEGYHEDNLFVQQVGSMEPRLLLPAENFEMVDFAWDASGGGLFILGNIGLRTELFHYDLDGDRLSKLTHGDHVITNWEYDHRTDRHLAIIRNETNPGEIYRLDPSEGGALALTRLTGHYRDWPERFALPRQEAFRWTGRKRQELEGLLVYPVGHVAGERFPLVTITHGGPRSSSQFGSWNDSRFVAVLAGEGYGVFLPNHRGGTGYGDAFMRDMVGGYFTHAHHDVMDGIDALIERGLADPDRLIKMGWSAGGHMTNKLITETGRFKAASSGAGASDWLSMYGESDIRHDRTPWFGDAPWVRKAPIKSYRDQSVIQNAWQVTTPTVFYVGGDDVRVPPTQSILLYRGIKAAGVPTELFIAKGEPHNFRKPSHQLFKIQTDLSWFASHLGRDQYVLRFPEAALREEDEEEKEKDEKVDEEPAVPDTTLPETPETVEEAQ